jgi:hypothetical protein
MTVKCSPELFRLFEEGCGGWVEPNEDGQIFLYEAMSDGESYPFTPISIPKLDKERFENWKKFEYWCDEIKNGLFWMLCDEDDSIFQNAFKNSTPNKYFKSKSALKNKIIEILCDGDLCDVESTWCVDIECDSKILYLIYLDSDAWVLGWGNSVLVLKSLDDLNIKNGFYPIHHSSQL